MRVGFGESIDSVLGSSEIDDASIDWLWASMILMGSVLSDQYNFSLSILRFICDATSIYPVNIWFS